MVLPYRIKCNCTGPRYLYWSGVHWTPEFTRAAEYETKREAQRVIATLNPPRIKDSKGRGPEAFTMDVGKIDEE